MKTCDYLTVADLLGIYAALMHQYGGAIDIRDKGAHEASVLCPQSGYAADIISEAAALMESLAVNHPFIDGNKRNAFAAVDIFLRINGWRLEREPMQIHAEMLGFFERDEFDKIHIEPWLRSFAVQAAST